MQSVLQNIKMWGEKKPLCRSNEEIKNTENSDPESFLQ